MIQEKLNKLYGNRKYKEEHFVSGGLVNEVLYKECNPKIAILLKEPNDPENDQGKRKNWSLTQSINDCIMNMSIPRMWQVSGIWSYAATSRYFPYFSKINRPEISAKGLEVIGITNLKKSGGGSQASSKVAEIAERDKLLWTEELKIMGPQIVLCGGTYWTIKPILGFKDKKLDCGLHCSTKENNELSSLIVEFYHPGYRVKHALMYSHLKELFSELIELEVLRL